MLSDKLTIVLFLALVSIFLNTQVIGNVRKSRTLRSFPRMLGLGPWCVGCPSHFCDDDPSIILGYCCGCARFTDMLPINCPLSTRCPLNTYQLCLDYEYMMYCCC